MVGTRPTGRPKGSKTRAKVSVGIVEAEARYIAENLGSIDVSPILTQEMARYWSRVEDENRRMAAGEEIDLAKSSRERLQFLKEAARAASEIKKATDGITINLNYSPEVREMVETIVREIMVKQVERTIEIGNRYIADKDSREAYAGEVRGLAGSTDSRRVPAAMLGGGQVDTGADGAD